MQNCFKSNVNSIYYDKNLSRFWNNFGKSSLNEVVMFKNYGYIYLMK